MPSNDQQLVRQVLAGNADAFGDLVERYSGLVRGVLLALLRRPDEVDDLAQDVFCKAYEALGDLRRETHFGPWLGQIARHRALHYLRHKEVRKRLESPEDEAFLPSVQQDPEQEVETSERDVLIWQALDQLAPEARRLVVLYHIENCTYFEIARFLQIPVATVRWRLLKAERTLGKVLHPLLGSQSSASKRDLRRRVLSGIALLGAPSRERPATTRTRPETAAKNQQPLLLSIAASLVLHLVSIGPLTNGARTDSQAVVHQVYGAGLKSIAFKAAAPTLPPTVPLVRWAPPTPAPKMLETATPMAPLPAVAHPSTLTTLAEKKIQPPAPSEPDIAAAAPAAADDLDLLNLENIARVSDRRAVVFSNAEDDAPMARLDLAPLALGGAGVSPALLDELSHFLRTSGDIEALLQKPSTHGFRASALLNYPIHFLLQDVGWPAYEGRFLTYFDAGETKHLGAYLRRGGFLYIEGHPRYLAEMYGHICRALEMHAAIRPLSKRHKLYGTPFNIAPYFADAFGTPRSVGKDWYRETNARRLAEWPHALGLWGIDIDGELAVLFSDRALLGHAVPAANRKEADYARAAQLRAVSNIVAYALQRSNGLVVRRARPRWTQIPARR